MGKGVFILFFLAAARMLFQPTFVAAMLLPKPKKARARPAIVISVLPDSSPPAAMLKRVAPTTPAAAVSPTPATFM